MDRAHGRVLLTGSMSHATIEGGGVKMGQSIVRRVLRNAPPGDTALKYPRCIGYIGLIIWYYNTMTKVLYNVGESRFSKIQNSQGMAVTNKGLVFRCDALGMLNYRKVESYLPPELSIFPNFLIYAKKSDR